MESSTSLLPRLPPSQPPTLFQRLDQLNEFEREPVTQDRLESRRHFAAVFAGEHVAGTEFVIGALFVSWGVGTRELMLGLLLGNLLAVLSWTFICAPIAVQTRLTLYWYLRRIAGPAVTTIYNVVNAILFCALAGAMITVSASAVRIPFGIPPQTHWYPTDFRFVLVVVAVGSVVVTIAILGFRRLAQFSTICVPWIFVIFFAGALAVLPQLTASSPQVGSIGSLDDLWRLAEERIWIGRQDSDFSLWHVAGFAWMCNLAVPPRTLGHGFAALCTACQLRFVFRLWNVHGPLFGVDGLGSDGSRGGVASEDFPEQSGPRGSGPSSVGTGGCTVCDFLWLGDVESDPLSSRSCLASDHTGVAPVAGHIAGRDGDGHHCSVFPSSSNTCSSS